MLYSGYYFGKSLPYGERLSIRVALETPTLDHMGIETKWKAKRTKIPLLLPSLYPELCSRYIFLETRFITESRIEYTSHLAKTLQVTTINIQSMRCDIT